MNYKQKFILEYFKALREDIIVRIQKNTTLWSLKITAAAFIFAYLGKAGIEDKGISVLLMSMVPWIAIIFDFLIVDNLLGIHNIANFIKHRIELTPQNSRVEGIMNEEFWEYSCGQKEGSRTLDRRHRVAIVLFALVCSLIPAVIYLHLTMKGTKFPFLLSYFLIVNPALVLVVEWLLCRWFKNRISCVEKVILETLQKHQIS